MNKNFNLSEKQFFTMYKAAKLLLFKDILPAKNKPIAILTGGQPGAGKSGIVLKSKKEFSEMKRNPIILDGDKYRGLYPKSIYIANEYPELYLDITNEITGPIMGKLIECAIDGGYDFIREGTLNSAEIVDQLLGSSNNYKIIIRLLAVSREESLLSIFERYIFMKKNMNIARFTTIEAHDKRFNQFIKTAREQANKGIEIEVYERGKEISDPLMIYKSSSKNNEYSNFEKAVEGGKNNSFIQCMKTAKVRLNRIEYELKKTEKFNSKVFEQLDELTKIINIAVRNNEKIE